MLRARFCTLPFVGEKTSGGIGGRMPAPVIDDTDEADEAEEAEAAPAAAAAEGRPVSEGHATASVSLGCPHC